MIKHGPVDVIVLAFAEPSFDGTILAELEKQSAAGTIRVLDALILLRDEDGQCWEIDLEDLPAELAAAIGFIETGTRGLLDEEDANVLFTGMAPGSTVIALAIEHTWAIALVNDIIDAGLDVALNYRIPAPIVDAAFASLA